MRTACRPDLLTCFCAALVALPAAAVVCAGAFVLVSHEQTLTGPGNLGAAIGVLGGVPFLIVQYHSIVRRSPRAAKAIARLMATLAALGVLGWVGGLIRLLFDMAMNVETDPSTSDLHRFLVSSELLVVLIVVSLGHSRWSRIMNSTAADRSL